MPSRCVRDYDLRFVIIFTLQKHNNKCIYAIIYHYARTYGTVRSDDQMREIGNLLSDYFAKKAVEGADRLWEDEVIDCTTIEEWKNQHMRTPYK